METWLSAATTGDLDLAQTRTGLRSMPPMGRTADGSFSASP